MPKGKKEVGPERQFQNIKKCFLDHLKYGKCVWFKIEEIIGSKTTNGIKNYQNTYERPKHSPLIV